MKNPDHSSPFDKMAAGEAPPSIPAAAGRVLGRREDIEKFLEALLPEVPAGRQPRFIIGNGDYIEGGWQREMTDVEHQQQIRCWLARARAHLAILRREQVEDRLGALENFRIAIRYACATPEDVGLTGNELLRLELRAVVEDIRFDLARLREGPELEIYRDVRTGLARAFGLAETIGDAALSLKSIGTSEQELLRLRRQAVYAEREWTGHPPFIIVRHGRSGLSMPDIGKEYVGDILDLDLRRPRPLKGERLELLEEAIRRSKEALADPEDPDIDF